MKLRKVIELHDGSRVIWAGTENGLCDWAAHQKDGITLRISEEGFHDIVGLDQEYRREHGIGLAREEVLRTERVGK